LGYILGDFVTNSSGHPAVVRTEANAEKNQLRKNGIHVEKDFGICKKMKQFGLWGD
jgi:hypothetical protein